MTWWFLSLPKMCHALRKNWIAINTVENPGQNQELAGPGQTPQSWRRDPGRFLCFTFLEIVPPVLLYYSRANIN